MHVIENLAPESLADHLAHTFYSPLFNWNYHYSTLAVSGEYADVGYRDQRVAERPQFSHSFIRDGEPLDQYWDLIQPLIDLLAGSTGYTPSRVIRAKANMLLKDPRYPLGSYHEPHVDVNVPGTSSMIYYVDSSDGDTHFFEEYYFDQYYQPVNNTSYTPVARVSPVRGSAVIFPSYRYHASSSPIVTDRRIVLNFVFAD
jgi:hypothetical protein